MIGRLERNNGGQFFLGKLGQTADGISVVQPDQANPLGVAADRPSIGDPGADEDSSSGGEHDLVGIRYLGHGHDGAVAVTGLDINEPFAATVLRPVFGQHGALAVSIAANRQKACRILFAVGNHHANNFVLLVEGDALDSVGGSAHGTNV